MMFVAYDELKEIIIELLSNDYVCISGDQEFIEFVENRIYTPKTPKNRDFWTLYAYPSNNYFAFGKKTEEFRELVEFCLHKPFNYDIIRLIEGTKKTEKNYRILTLECNYDSINSFTEHLLDYTH